MAVPKSKKSLSKTKIKRFSKQELVLKKFKMCKVCGTPFFTTKCSNCQKEFRPLTMI